MIKVSRSVKSIALSAIMLGLRPAPTSQPCRSAIKFILSTDEYLEERTFEEFYMFLVESLYNLGYIEFEGGWGAYKKSFHPFFYEPLSSMLAICPVDIVVDVLKDYISDRREEIGSAIQQAHTS